MPLAFQWPIQWLFYSLNCFKVELHVVKMCHYLCTKCLMVCIALMTLLKIFAMFNHLVNFWWTCVDYWYTSFLQTHFVIWWIDVPTCFL